MGSTTTSAVGQFLRQRSDAFAEEWDSAKGLVRSTVIPIPTRQRLSSLNLHLLHSQW